MAATSWWWRHKPPRATRHQLLARAVTVTAWAAASVRAQRTAPLARADAIPNGSSLLATIGDDAIAPTLRAAAVLDLSATPTAVPGGWFVPIFGDQTGFAILDEAGGAPMATAVASLGGIATFGPPVSRPFLTAEGWIAQIMVRAVVACEPPGGSGNGAGVSGVIVSAPDLLHQAGIDDLLGASGVPLGAPPPRSPVDAWHRLGWITDRAIRAAYLAPVPVFRVENGPTPPSSGDSTPRENGPNPSSSEYSTPLPYEGRGAPEDADAADGSAPRGTGRGLPDLATIAGPPTSLVVTTGAWRRQRFERAIIEVAVAEGDAASDRDGTDRLMTPVIVPVGLLLRRAMSLPTLATAPDSYIGGTVVVRGPMATVGWRVAPVAGTVDGFAEAVPLSTPTPLPTRTPDATIRGPAATVSASPVSTATPTTAPSAPTPASGARVPGAAIRVRSVAATGGTERVILANDGSVPQEVGGWAVRSGASSTAYRLPVGLRLDPGATVALLSGRDAPAVAPVGSVTLARRSLWRDDGGTVLLIDHNGDEVDRHTWP